ncbi:MAG TPA: winged helix DNA-binding domain-containing protein [Streptosporangiaceae bacterium]|nr:winged helix DNA-binding domain-containing protein [Streptosporangiaceae bacterium]
MTDGRQVPIARARAHVLAKQGLAGQRLAAVGDALVGTAGIYGTAPTCYLSAAARTADFTLADLDAELYDKRSVVRLRCMRGMAYIQPVELVSVLFACTGEAPDRTLRRIGKYSGLGEDGVLALADHVVRVMAGRPPMTVREIREALGADVPPGAREGLQFTVGLLGRTGRIVRAEVRGSWRSDNYAYALWDDWVGAPVEPVDPAAARVELARRYLRAFGPATAADLKWWAGWTKRDTDAALAALGDELTPVSLDGVDAVVLTAELAALEGAGPGAAGREEASPGPAVRLLPVWDSYLMAYATGPAGRARQVAEADYAKVYDKSGNATSTVIVDGTAAGVWELDPDAGRVTVAPFGDAMPWADLEAEVAVIAAAIGTDLRLDRAAPPGPLSAGPRNAFLSPISLCAPAK